MIISAAYNRGGLIVANVAGEARTIPDDLQNPDRQMVVAWEAEGNTIDPYVAVLSATDVKAEAGRRIEAIMPDYKQRNVMAWGLETILDYGTDPADWPAELRAVNDAAQAAWTAIKAIRIRSDEIEAMNPIPTDFRDDGYWSVE